jgi:hypothetical protein
VTVELKLHHLAVCAVDKAQLLAELEGAGGSADGATFRVLAALVSSWLGDATRHSNPIADHLLQNLYRCACPACMPRLQLVCWCRPPPAPPSPCAALPQ